jgi:hypothetical protein
MRSLYTVLVRVAVGICCIVKKARCNMVRTRYIQVEFGQTMFWSRLHSWLKAKQFDLRRDFSIASCNNNLIW